MKPNPLRGAYYLVQGLRLMFDRRLRPFIWIPLLLSLLIYSVLLGLALHSLGLLMDHLLPDTSWLVWLRWLLWPLLMLALLLIMGYSFTSLANLIAAPFNSLLAERTEMLLTGRVPGNQKPWSALTHGWTRDLGSEIHKILYFLLRALPLLLLFVVPVANLAAPLLWLLFSAWSLALQYMDYPLANHGFIFRQQRAQLRGHGLTLLGFGAAASFVLMLPVIGFLAMPATVVGATLLRTREIPLSASAQTVIPDG